MPKYNTGKRTSSEKSPRKKIYSGSKTSKPLKKLEKVEWKPIPTWGKYEASTDGEIRNFWTENILKKYFNGDYYTVRLCSTDGNETCFLHRLVAETYLENPKNLPVVDHINNNKLDNRLENLRWVTVKENNDYYNKNFRQLRAILQYDKEGNLIKKWKSMTEILKKNSKYRRGAIYHYIKGNSKAAYGYVWKYEIPIIRNKKPNPNEEFKQIGIYVGINDVYDFSNYGASGNGNIINIKKNTLMIHQKNGEGYMKTTLFCKKYKKNVSISVHRLVAYIYVHGYHLIKKNEVNHIDKNRSNNYYKNLEWVTHQENIAHSHGKAVKMIDMDTDEIINIFTTVSDAERHLGRANAGHIGAFCNGNPKFRSVYGYKWEWLKKDEVIDKPIITVPINKKNKK